MQSPLPPCVTACVLNKVTGDVSDCLINPAQDTLQALRQDVYDNRNDHGYLNTYEVIEFGSPRTSLSSILRRLHLGADPAPIQRLELLYRQYTCAQTLQQATHQVDVSALAMTEVVRLHAEHPDVQQMLLGLLKAQHPKLLHYQRYAQQNFDEVTQHLQQHLNAHEHS